MSSSSAIIPDGLDGHTSASNVDAVGDSEMALEPNSMSAEPQPPKKFHVPFQEESSSSPEPAPKKAKIAKRKPTNSRRPVKKK